MTTRKLCGLVWGIANPNVVISAFEFIPPLPPFIVPVRNMRIAKKEGMPTNLDVHSFNEKPPNALQTIKEAL